MPTSKRYLSGPMLPTVVATVAAAAIAALANDPASEQPTPPTLAPAPAPVQPAPAPASTTEERPETEVTLRDGRTLTGVLIREEPSRIFLEIAGIETPFRRDDIDRIVTLPSVDERYERLRASIDARDAAGLLRLSQWLLARGRYAQALLEVDRALDVEPSNADAIQHRTLVIEQARLADARATQPAKPNDNTQPATQPAQPAPQPARDDFPLLTQDQINLIRVYEVDLDNPPRMFLSRDDALRFLSAFGGQGGVPATKEGKDAFLRLPVSKQLEAMFAVRAREFYPKVRVAEHPRSMQRFRDDVLRGWVTNACATTQCHGGADAGRLRLYNRRSGSDEAVYTNFLILDRFRTDDGLPLIDYAQPSRSPLLHMALPKDQSLFPHPDTPGTATNPNARRWQPAFRSDRDERFTRTVEWIGMMFQPRPDYPIEYTPPGPSTPEAPSQPPQPR
jgi:hypothetical protein